MIRPRVPLVGERFKGPTRYGKEQESNAHRPGALPNGKRFEDYMEWDQVQTADGRTTTILSAPQQSTPDNFHRVNVQDRYGSNNRVVDGANPLQRMVMTGDPTIRKQMGKPKGEPTRDNLDDEMDKIDYPHLPWVRKKDQDTIHDFEKQSNLKKHALSRPQPELSREDNEWEDKIKMNRYRDDTGQELQRQMNAITEQFNRKESGYYTPGSRADISHDSGAAWGEDAVNNLQGGLPQDPEDHAMKDSIMMVQDAGNHFDPITQNAKHKTRDQELGPINPKKYSFKGSNRMSKLLQQRIFGRNLHASERNRNETDQESHSIRASIQEKPESKREKKMIRKRKPDYDREWMQEPQIRPTQSQKQRRQRDMRKDEQYSNPDFSTDLDDRHHRLSGSEVRKTRKSRRDRDVRKDEGIGYVDFETDWDDRHHRLSGSEVRKTRRSRKDRDVRKDEDIGYIDFDADWDDRHHRLSGSEVRKTQRSRKDRDVRRDESLGHVDFDSDWDDRHHRLSGAEIRRTRRSRKDRNVRIDEGLSYVDFETDWDDRHHRLSGPEIRKTQKSRRDRDVRRDEDLGHVDFETDRNDRYNRFSGSEVRRTQRSRKDRDVRRDEGLGYVDFETDMDDRYHRLSGPEVRRIQRSKRDRDVRRDEDLGYVNLETDLDDRHHRLSGSEVRGTRGSRRDRDVRKDEGLGYVDFETDLGDRHHRLSGSHVRGVYTERDEREYSDTDYDWLGVRDHDAQNGNEVRDEVRGIMSKSDLGSYNASTNVRHVSVHPENIPDLRENKGTLAWNSTRDTKIPNSSIGGGPGAIANRTEYWYGIQNRAPAERHGERNRFHSENELIQDQKARSMGAGRVGLMGHRGGNIRKKDDLEIKKKETQRGDSEIGTYEHWDGDRERIRTEFGIRDRNRLATALDIAQETYGPRQVVDDGSDNDSVSSASTMSTQSTRSSRSS